MQLTFALADIDEFYHVPDIVKPGQTISATSTTRRLGGKGLNQACAAASAGIRVILDGAVGAGQEGAAVIEELKKVKGGEKGKIDCERIRQEEKYQTGKAVIQLAVDGENSISEYLATGGTNTSIADALRQSFSPEPTFRHHQRTRRSFLEASLTFSSPMKFRSTRLWCIYGKPPLKASQPSTTPLQCLPQSSSSNSTGKRWIG